MFRVKPIDEMHTVGPSMMKTHGQQKFKSGARRNVLRAIEIKHTILEAFDRGPFTTDRRGYFSHLVITASATQLSPSLPLYPSTTGDGIVRFLLTVSSGWVSSSGRVTYLS